MTILRNIAILFFLASYGCNQTSPKPLTSVTDSVQYLKNTSIVQAQDTSNQNIYDFMKLVIADQKLNLSYGLSIDPEPGCDLSQDDKTFLKKLLIEKSKSERQVDTGDWKTRTITVNLFELEKCLTKDDINYMLLQKEKLSTFKWDNSRLKFNLKNDSNWYCFSIPIFSKNKTKAVMMVRNLCRGLCGTGWTVLFTKENNKWASQTGGQWIH